MRDRILKLWLLFLHTCMFNTFSIVAGSMLSFAWMAGLSLYFPLITTLIICPLLTFTNSVSRKPTASVVGGIETTLQIY